MTTAVMTITGQVVIPAKIRKHLNLKKGVKLYVEERGPEVVIRPVTKDYFDKVAGILSTRGRLSEALLNEHRKEKVKEAMK